MTINQNITFAEFHAIQLGHVEQWIKTVDGYRSTDPFTHKIHDWICSKIQDNMPLTSMESCNIEDIGRDTVFARYIVDLPVGQEAFIHFYINAHGLEITFLLWGEDDPDRDGDPVKTWGFSSSDDDVVLGMAKNHLRMMLGSRSFGEIMNLYK